MNDDIWLELCHPTNEARVSDVVRRQIDWQQLVWAKNINQLAAKLAIVSSHDNAH
jgi:hypothetical protein